MVAGDWRARTRDHWRRRLLPAYVYCSPLAALAQTHLPNVLWLCPFRIDGSV